MSKLAGHEFNYWSTPDDNIRRWYFKDGSYISSYKTRTSFKYRKVEVNGAIALAVYDNLSKWKRFEIFRERP